MQISIVPIYAAILGFLLVKLSIDVIRIRIKEKAALGDNNCEELKRAIRVQGNFIEYVPIALLLTAFVELRQMPWYLVHGLCLMLLSGRLIHAFGISKQDENIKLRQAGMMLTFSCIIFSGLTILASYIFNLSQ